MSIAMDEFSLIAKFFPQFNTHQLEQMAQLKALYEEWNAQINVISRKDVESLYERHVLHSLAIYQFLPFQPGSAILDVGTGGGFPGIPLAIAQPEVHFTLVDSIGKKIKVVREISQRLGLTNVTAIHGRAEEVKGSFDFVVTRAVAPAQELLQWTRKKYANQQRNALPNGLLALKGGDLTDELKNIPHPIEVHQLFEMFPLPFFETKKLVYIAM
jgi:16S rRNA (guanine527-N7)-methyltransferase